MAPNLIFFELKILCFRGYNDIRKKNKTRERKDKEVHYVF